MNTDDESDFFLTLCISHGPVDNALKHKHVSEVYKIVFGKMSKTEQ